MAQHLAPLLGQGGELRCDLVLSCDADLQDLLGFLPGGQAAQGRQVQGDASRILRLAHPMALGHPEKRCDGIGTDRHADVIEPECRSGLQLEVKIGAKLLTQRGRGHGCNQRCTFIKRALVRTLGGAKHASIVCLSVPEIRPQADRKVSKLG